MDTQLPTPTQSLHYPQEPIQLLDDLATLGDVHVHFRTRSSSLESVLPLGMSIHEEDEGLLFFPECNLSLRSSLLQEVHASQVAIAGGRELALEMDFLSAPNGVSISTHRRCDQERFRRVLLHHPYTIACRREIEQKRIEDSPPPCMCNRCAAIAKARRESPEKHPLTLILRHAEQEQVSLLCRIDASHGGFSQWLTPASLTTRHGVITIADESNQTRLHVNLGFAHSLWVVKTKIDGDAYSIVRVFDSLGHLSVELAAPNPNLVWLWEQICETAEPLEDGI